MHFFLSEECPDVNRTLFQLCVRPNSVRSKKELFTTKYCAFGTEYTQRKKYWLCLIDNLCVKNVIIVSPNIIIIIIKENKKFNSNVSFKRLFFKYHLMPNFPTNFKERDNCCRPLQPATSTELFYRYTIFKNLEEIVEGAEGAQSGGVVHGMCKMGCCWFIFIAPY